jgi:hypothetical protein
MVRLGVLEIRMSLIPNAIAAWRNERGIEDAIRDHDRAGLAKAIALALTFIFTLARGTKYAQYVSFIDPDMLTGAGLLAAGAIAAVGHWATRGALVAAAAGQRESVDRDSPQPAAQPSNADRAQPAERGAPDQVQRGPDALSRQDDESMRAGGG